MVKQNGASKKNPDKAAHKGEPAALWQGRFGSQPVDQALFEYTESLSFDRALLLDDLRGSRAHVRGLARAGVLNPTELDTILSALGQVEDEYHSGSLVFPDDIEDVHTYIEHRVIAIAGDVGAKLHSGRSRNDQVATALRLFTIRNLVATGELVVALQETLVARAKEALAERIYLPGYTHLQRAQPVSLAHHLLAHAWAFARDGDRLAECVSRADRSVLGAGALAGSSLSLDPDGVAQELGFSRRFQNSLDAVADRDFVADTLYALAMVGIHLSRMGEEVVLWTTEEFGFATLDDRFATGSSMLPQKKNPDIAELARGKTGRLVGNLVAMLTTLKGLPLSYNRDLQEDKEPLFDSFRQINLGLRAFDGMVATMRVHPERMAVAADSPFAAATDLAEILVRYGRPFRQAHEVVGSLVKASLDRQISLAELALAHPAFGEHTEELEALFFPGAVVARRTTPGGGSHERAEDQLDSITMRLDTAKARLGMIAERHLA